MQQLAPVAVLIYPASAYRYPTTLSCCCMYRRTTHPPEDCIHYVAASGVQVFLSRRYVLYTLTRPHIISPLAPAALAFPARFGIYTPSEGRTKQGSPNPYMMTFSATTASPLFLALFLSVFEHSVLAASAGESWVGGCVAGWLGEMTHAVRVHYIILLAAVLSGRGMKITGWANLYTIVVACA